MIRRIINTYRSEGSEVLYYKSKKEAYKKIRKNRILHGVHQFYLYTNTRYKFQKLKYTTPANPLNPIWVDPKNVKHKNIELKYEWGLGRITPGKWDDKSNCELIEDIPIYIGLKERFEKNYKWENTALYAHIEQKMKNENDNMGYKSMDEWVYERGRYIDNLYEKIKNEGYIPNYKRGNNVNNKSSRNSLKHQLEPLVTINRKGEIYWREGYHRYAISRILNIEKIPVYVLARHEKWQKVRESISKNNKCPDFDCSMSMDHADLQDIVNC